MAAGAAQAQSATYAIDPTHTFVSFEVSHFGTSTNRGRFDKKEGTVQFDRAGKTGRVEINIDTTSINSGVAQFDSHLKSKDFFNVAEHPTARFVGDKFSFEGDKVTAVQGTLTMLGKSHPVTLKANQFNCYLNPMFKREVCGLTGVHSLRRVDLLHDVGDSIDELIDRGQIEGGFVQGMGWLTSEELRWNAQGRLLTDAS